MAVSPDGATAYVTNAGNDTVSVINTATNTVTATIGIHRPAYGVAISPDGSTAYVTNQGDLGGGPVTAPPPGTVSVIELRDYSTVDPSTGMVTGTVTATDPAGLPLTYSVATQPTDGTATVTPTGGFTYTPTPTARVQANNGGATTDSFTVTASNGVFTSSPSTITVPITPVAIIIPGP